MCGRNIRMHGAAADHVFFSACVGAGERETRKPMRAPERDVAQRLMMICLSPS